MIGDSNMDLNGVKMFFISNHILVVKIIGFKLLTVLGVLTIFRGFLGFFYPFEGKHRSYPCFTDMWVEGTGL